MFARFKILSSLVAIFFLIIFYQNCGIKQSVDQQTKNSTNTPELSATPTDPCQNMKTIFSQTYAPFLRTNCNNCHISGGLGKGAFADSSIDIAWASFEFAGFTKISEFAVDPGHKAPFTGAKNTAAINRNREKWVTGLAEQVRCNNSAPTTNENINSRFNTSAKTVGLSKVGDEKIMTWNLATELSADRGLNLPKLPGAILSVKVEVVEVLGQIAYYVSEPSIKNSQVDIHINSLRTKINGNFIPGETTFNFVDKNIYKNTNTLLSAGTMVALGLNNIADKLQISIGDITATQLPPPDLGPEVSFQMASQSHAEKGVVSLQVSLSRPPTQAVVVQIEFDKSTTGKLRRSPRDEEKPYDHFDWDFTLGAVATPASNASLTFVPGGELTKNLDVTISDDQRFEPNEKAVLSIVNIKNGVPGTFTEHTITVTDDDITANNPFIKTFSELMSESGVLNQRCLECHNTVRKEGGYDMTDYDSMTSLSKLILVPGNPLTSQMYVRLRLEEPGRMPLDQALDAKDQREIENWIRDGAKNN